MYLDDKKPYVARKVDKTNILDIGLVEKSILKPILVNSIWKKQFRTVVT